MTEKLLDKDIQHFINQNLGAKSSTLALTKNPFPSIDFKIILNQIEAKTKAKDKLPTWFENPSILYPNKISIEQTSSEKTAQYKASLVFGNSLLDASGGFGIDDYFFSKKIKQIYHCEINSDLSTIVNHNFNQLQCNNITCITGDSSDILKNLNQQLDYIYIDPSRRNEQKGKVFMLQDCLPNVPLLQDFYFQYTSNILIKTAPILDLTSGINELKNVKNIHIIALNNEVKELLWEIEKNYQKEITIKTINIQKKETELFDFQLSNTDNVSYTLPQKYLYEPNSAIMKSGGFNQIAIAFSLDKLHIHSHLYTSNNLIAFPGRIFEIINKISYSKTEMKSFLQNTKANITTRNFPETVENIRKKWSIKDGGNIYCFFTTNQKDEKIVLICKKIENDEKN